MGASSSRRPIRVVLVGTGTGIGKTHVACSLLSGWVGRGVPAVGLKPIETGVPAVSPRKGDDSDQARLLVAGRGSPGRRPRQAGLTELFHVKQSDAPSRSLYALPPPISPHIAAREAGIRFDLTEIDRWVADHSATVTIVETAGALFSPIGQATTNFDLMVALRPDAVVLVAPDRLGVLHELTTTIALATARGGPPMCLALSAPQFADASSGRNGAELRQLRIAEVTATFPRARRRTPESRAAEDCVIEWIERRCGIGPRRRATLARDVAGRGHG